MQLLSGKMRAVSSLLLIIVLASAAFADTIRLKDGSIVKGRITSFGGGKFVVSVGGASGRKNITFSAGEVESIQFDDTATLAATPRSTNIARASYTPPRMTESPAADRVVTAPVTKPTVSAPRTTSPVVPSVSTVTKPVSTAASSVLKPVLVNVKVLADNTNNGWTNSGWVVKRGQRIRITGEGSVSLGGGKTTEPGGLYDIEDESRLLKGAPTGALIAVIGDDNNDFIYVGETREFTASRDGSLFLGVNEGNLADNTGSFAVRVEILPGEGS